MSADDAFRVSLIGCALALLGPALFGAADRPHYGVDAWTMENGLPDNSIKALCQTRDGYLWMTTGDGLVRFDGVTFRVFNTANTPALKTNQYSFYALIEDRNGALWAGTEAGGVVRYDSGRFTAYTVADGLPHNKVLRVDEDEEGTIWIFTMGGLARWRNAVLLTAPQQADSNEDPYDSPAVLGADRIFFGLWRLDSRAWSRFAYGRWTQLPLPPGIDKPAGLRIGSIVEDARRRLWFTHSGARNVVYCITAGRMAAIAGPGPDVHAAYQDRTGNLLVGDRKGHVGLFKNGDVQWLDGISTPSVFRVLEDREGQLWIGTKNEGLYRIREEVLTVRRRPGGPEFNAGRVLMRDRAGDVWFGTSSGLARYSNGRVYNYFRRGSLSFERPNVVTALYEDTDGIIWVGSLVGISRFKDGRYLESPPSFGQLKQSVYAIHRDRAGHLWIGGRDGLWRLRDGALERYGPNDAIRGASIRTIFEDSSGVLWFGTESGLWRLSSGRLTSFTAVNGLSSGAIVSLHGDAQGILWAGSNEDGLTRLAPGPDGLRLTRYTKANGLHNNGVYQIIEDDVGFFWISSRAGIYRLRKQDLNDFAEGRLSQVSCTHLKSDDFVRLAFVDDVGNPGGFKAPDGQVWFATLSGIASVDPRKVPATGAPPSVVIEDCIADHRRLDCREGLRLTPGWENLEITYTALSLIRSNQIRFKYRLEGLHDQWVDAGGRRTALYAHVPPGRYTFRVIAANSDGVWNPVGATLNIAVLPPFYRTLWFTVATILSGVAMALAMHNRRVAQIRSSHAAQEAFSRQLIESQEEERKRIAAELHDSLGQTLLIIKNRAVLGAISPGIDDSVRDQFQEIGASATQSIEEVRHIAYNLRPLHLDRLGLTQALEAMVEQVAASTTIHFSCEIDPIDGLFSKEADITVFRIIQEYLNNIVKHSNASGARVKVVREAFGVIITVQDNGCGFSAEQVQASGKAGLGLLGVTERVRILGGRQLVDSAPGKGTTVVIELPTGTAVKAASHGP